MALKPGKLAASLVVFTANRLRDGRVVWLAGTPPDARWSETFADATIFPGDRIEAAQALASAGEAAQFLVGAYPVVVTQGAAGTQPERERERLRAFGPSIPAA